jgi:hypothetical protein
MGEPRSREILMDIALDTAHGNYLPAAAINGGTDINGTSRTVGDFWAWAYTDLLDSMTRGTLAEYIVKTALSIDAPVRDNGSAFDLLYGERGIQVKSSSAVQRWTKIASPRISFGIKHARPYVSELADYGEERIRSGDCWIFCVLLPSSRDLDVARVEMLDVANWRFWAVPTRWLPITRSSITLDALRSPFATMVEYRGLRAAVDEAIRLNRNTGAVPSLAPMTATEWQEEEGLHLVPKDRLERIVKLVETTTAEMQGTHAGWTTDFRPGFAGIRSAGNSIRLQVRADLFENGGHDVRLGLRVPPRFDAQTRWPGEIGPAGRDSWWSVNSTDLPNAGFVAEVLRDLYPVTPA